MSLCETDLDRFFLVFFAPLLNLGELVFERRETDRDFEFLFCFGDLDCELVLRGDFDLLWRTAGDLDFECLERRGEGDLLFRLGVLDLDLFLRTDLDLDRLFLFIRDLDLLRITTDRERVRLILLTDLDLLARDTGVLLRERDRDRLPLRTDLERDFEPRVFLRESDRFDLDRDRRSLTADLDLVRRPRRRDLDLDLLALVRDLESDRCLLFPEWDLDFRLVPLTDLDRDLCFSDGDLDCLLCITFFFEVETDLSLDRD